MTVHYQDDDVTVYHGDCLDVLAELGDGSVDAIVTDPPYGLNFMGKAWDTGAVAFDTALWEHCLRVLKPGGHLVAFGGTRTWHRLACAIEDTGFEIRDSIAWLYGSGFPKSLDVSKAIDNAAGAERDDRVVGDYGTNKVLRSHTKTVEYAGTPVTEDAKRWQGWGTALKPAFEPAVLARKSLAGTVAANVAAHGTGALNIDACRVGTDFQAAAPTSAGGMLRLDGFSTVDELRAAAERGEKCPNGRDARATLARVETFKDRIAGWRKPPPGRWPTNVVLDEHTAAEVDQQAAAGNSDTDDGASQFFPVFRYCAKADRRERPTVNGVSHPTVKPLELMRWLIRLVTPPGGVVLDPFAGSGTTGEAALLERKRAILIEREGDYLPLIVARLTKPLEVGLDLDGCM